MHRQQKSKTKWDKILNGIVRSRLYIKQRNKQNLPLEWNMYLLLTLFYTKECENIKKKDAPLHEFTTRTFRRKRHHYMHQQEGYEIFCPWPHGSSDTSSLDQQVQNQLIITKCMIFLFLILKGPYASICLPKLSFFPDHVWNGLPAHQPRLPTCGDCKVELKHLFADVATLTEPDQPGHKVRALLDVHLIVGVSPELIHKLQLPLLCVEGDFPFNEEALPLFIR